MTDRDKLLLKPEDVADRLSLSRSEVYRLIDKGVIPAVRVEGTRQTRVRMGDLAAWVRTLARKEAEKA